ncbi:MAG: hypothetical protein WD471_01185 [Candidatus Paceibacterota bacterium]
MNKLLKIIPLGVIGLLLSLLTFNLFNDVLVNLDFGDFFLVLLYLGLFVVILILQILFIPKFNYLFWTVLAQTLIPVLVFRDYLFSDQYLLPLIGIAFFSYFTILSVRKSFRDLQNSISIRFFTVARRASPRIVSGALIFFAIFSYFYFFQLGNFSNETAENVFDKTLDTALPMAQIWFPDLNFDLTVDEALEEMSRSQLEESQDILLESGIDYQSAPPSVKDNLINQTSIHIKNSIEEVTGTLDSDQTFREALFLLVSGKVTGLPLNTRLIIAAISILLIFGVFRGAAWAVYFPAEIIAFLLFKLLLATGFGGVTFKETNKEVITI